MSSEPIFERNLTRLLREAYQPVLPRESFRAGLERDFVARAARLGSRRPRAPGPVETPSRWLRPVAVLAAAAAALLLLLFGPWRDAGSTGLESILTGGRVAQRSGPGVPWTAVEARTLSFTAGGLELVTPSALGIAVESAGGRLELEPDSRASLGLEGGLRVDLLGGSLRVEPSGAVTVSTEEGALRAESGRAWAGLVGEGEQRGLRLVVEEGRVVVDARPFAAPARVLLRDGRVVEPEADGGLVAVAEPGGRTPADTTGRGPSEADPALETGAGQATAAQLRGRAWLPAEPLPATEDGSDGAAGEPRERAPETFRVILLEQVALPMVAEPLLFDFDGTGGEFAVSGVDPGTYAVFARAPGCALWRGEALRLEEGVEHALEVRFEPGRRLEGLVIDEETGLPVPGALVVSESDAPLQILSLDGAEFADRPGVLPMTTTASDGSFVLGDLSGGEHVLRASAPGYGPQWIGPFPIDGPEAAPVEFELAAGGRLEGSVRDAAGAAIEDALLILSITDFGARHPVMSFAQALTDGGGEFAFEHLPEGYWPLLHFGPVGELEDESGAGAEPELTFVRITAGEVTRQDFAPPLDGATFSGRLVLPDGSSAAGRSVWLTPAQGAGTEMVSTNADADGGFRFEGLAPRLYALFTSRGAPPDMVMLGSIDLRDGADLLDHEVLLPAGSIAGRVLDGVSKAPMARAVILLIGSEDGGESFFAKTFTDAAGRFVFDFAPPGSFETQVVSNRPGWGQARVASLSLGTGEALDLGELFLYPGGSLRLAAVDGDGSPVPGVEVDLIFEDGALYNLVEQEETGSDGLFEVPGLSAGSWTAVLTGAGHPRREVRFRVERSDLPTEVTVELGR